MIALAVVSTVLLSFTLIFIARETQPEFNANPTTVVGGFIAGAVMVAPAIVCIWMLIARLP